MARLGVRLPPAGQYGVGMVFLPRDPASRIACEYEIERAIKEEGQVLLGWRDVPVDNSDLAEPARRIEPVIRQVFIGRGRGITVTDALERKLYIIRKSSGHAIQALRLQHGKEFYVPSMSARTLCCKGMLLAYQVGEYYLDLKDARVESALALVHQRFSTNTFPSWDLAEPLRMICHNGEINTLRGNVNWNRARQGAISSPILGKDPDTIWPRIVDDKELKDSLAGARPYAEWIERIRVKLDEVETEKTQPYKSRVPLIDRQQAAGYTQEDLKFILQPMSANGEEPVGSMGNDSPLAVLSNKNKTLYHYFKQLFAQVTNPAIDPIREDLVMSLVSFIGPKPNLLGIDELNPPLRLEVSQPVLDFYEMEKIRHIERYTAGKFKSWELDITYPRAWGNAAVEARLASLAAQAEDAVRSGYSIIVISDRLVDRERVAIPALLALSAIHQHLVGKGLRTSTGLVVETGSTREVHHFALLGAYGAEAVHPYLALETVLALSPGSGSKAIKNYVKAIGKGLKKVMSKMGISTYMSYTGSQQFEALGLPRSMVEKYFTGTASNIEGIDLFQVADEAIRVHRAAFDERDPVLATMLDSGGEYAWRVRGEDHAWTPDAIAKLQHSARANSYGTYKEYAALINDQSKRHHTFRGLFEFRFDQCKPRPIDEVESAAEIVKRFSTGAMSLGSISTEAHTTLAIAMNRIGGRSNTGEGGEDRRRYAPVKAGESLQSRLGKGRVEVDIPLRAGDSLKSKIKQVASGRFGVTAEYLASAEMLQIKIAQGAKPGEGGQLPGRKVSEYIAELRYATPGVELISPPPHPDLSSTEVLAQLIHDLKNSNPEAWISVKLVSEVGVGTIAAGVAKGKSDHVTIAGHDGGTGASPWSSIKHAGTPWELGLAETQQTLVLNRLRGRIAVQVDGQMKTGRDVVVGAILGADEFGFATAPLVVEGCIMMRKCHLNTCPVGIATQDPQLRRKFEGKPEHVVNYFFFVAEEVRELMAQLGVRRLD